ncbi:hypothetical protein MPSEU_000014400 [Mayamaea pseudoterrestris]|nr:hypothetical protein MPSEU_000014400 [Mayamaea pseudoterrestris]
MPTSSYPEMKRPPAGKVPVLDEQGSLVSVPAIMNYIASTSSQVMHIRRDKSGDDQSIEGVVWDSVDVNVMNGRSANLSLFRNGFGLTDFRGSNNKPIDFLDSLSVINDYYPACESLLQEHLGENVLVKAFDHNVRLNERVEEAGTTLKRGGASKTQQPVGIVHGDYTRNSAPQRLEQLAGPPKVNDVLRLLLKEGESLLDAELVEEAVLGKRRFALINVWRNIDPLSPVKSQPLACVDAQSASVNDLKTLQIHYEDRVGENYLPFYNAKHRWFYFPDMVMDEALLLKQWDSSGGIASGEMDDSNGCSSFSLHSAFIGPCEETMPPRQSIEVRCVCIW